MNQLVYLLLLDGFAFLTFKINKKEKKKFEEVHKEEFDEDNDIDWEV